MAKRSPDGGEMSELSDRFDTITKLRRRLYRILAATLPERGRGPVAFSPPLDIVSGPEGVTITVELPGVERENVQVELRDQVLTISGERRPEADKEAETVYRRERPYGRFSRSLALPTSEERKVTANLRDGVLTVRVSK